MIRAFPRFVVSLLRAVFWITVAVVGILSLPWIFGGFVIAVAVVGVLALIGSILVVVAWRRT